MDEATSKTSQPPQTDVTREANENPNEKRLLRWRKHNAYYYKWLNRIYKFVVRPNSRVLHVGCECGDLLAAVEPSYGVGIVHI
jgi:hypothetical protein